MNKMPIIVTFVTLNTPYIKVVDKYFVPSLKKQKLKYYIDYIKNRGSWLDNVRYKSIFIKKMLLKFQKPIISLDADAEIINYPILFTQLKEYDIAVHYFDWYRYWRGVLDNPLRVALGGTLYFNYNEITLKFVDKWINQQIINDTFPQTDMQAVLKQEENNLKVFKLPAEYCTIIKKDGQSPKYIKKTYIQHNQVSRRLKK